ncbi:hypothetical protein ACS0TY_012331 [Phlomoides rotata]
MRSLLLAQFRVLLLIANIAPFRAALEDQGLVALVHSSRMETLKRHHPLAGLEGFLYIKRTTLLFEENIFIEATSPTDYLRKISVRMLDFEMRSQNQYSLHSYGASNYRIESIYVYYI